jgi:hypothetical protein
MKADKAKQIEYLNDNLRIAKKELKLAFRERNDYKIKLAEAMIRATNAEIKRLAT